MLRKLACLLLLSSSYGLAQTPAPPPRPVLIRAARLLDLRSGKYVANPGVLIEGDKIKEVGRLAEVQAHASAGATTIDLGRATLLPGLIDCHAHLLISAGAVRPGEIFCGRSLA